MLTAAPRRAHRRAAGVDISGALNLVGAIRTAHHDVDTASSHGLAETGELTGPVVELDSERAHVDLLVRAA